MPFRIMFVALLFMIPMIPTFWALIDIPKRQFPQWKSKVIWFAIVSTVPFAGAMLYILFIRRHTQPKPRLEPSTPREEEIRTDA
ncbi:MAG: PLDc N-terminal domain-containing protein [Syntrophobacter sp.]